MQVRIEDVSPVEKKLFVEVPWETVSEKLGDAYKELGKGVALKGFRKGKVPRPGARAGLRPARQCRGRVRARARIVLQGEPRASARRGRRAARRRGRADRKGQPFTFNAIIEVRGEVTPVDYTGLEIERRKLNVPESAVDEALAQLRREHTELRPIEGREVTAAGDIVGLSISGTIGEHEINQPQFAVDLDDAEREPLPGIRDALLGLPLDTKDKMIELDVPADAKDESIRGRHATLTVTVLEARAKDVPELDDEFAKDTGKADTLDGLKAALRKELEAREQEQIDREAREDALREVDQEESDPGRELARRALGRDAVSAAAPDARHEARARQPGPHRRAARQDAARRRRRSSRPALARGDRRQGRAHRHRRGDRRSTSRTRRRRATSRPRSCAPNGSATAGSTASRTRCARTRRSTILVGQAKVTEVEKLTQQGTPLPVVPARPR